MRDSMGSQEIRSSKDSNVTLESFARPSLTKEVQVELAAFKAAKSLDAESFLDWLVNVDDGYVSDDMIAILFRRNNEGNTVAHELAANHKTAVIFLEWLITQSEIGQGSWLLRLLALKNDQDESLGHLLVEHAAAVPALFGLLKELLSKGHFNPVFAFIGMENRAGKTIFQKAAWYELVAETPVDVAIMQMDLALHQQVRMPVSSREGVNRPAKGHYLISALKELSRIVKAPSEGRGAKAEMLSYKLKACQGLASYFKRHPGLVPDWQLKLEKVMHNHHEQEASCLPYAILGALEYLNYAESTWQIKHGYRGIKTMRDLIKTLLVDQTDILAKVAASTQKISSDYQLKHGASLFWKSEPSKHSRNVIMKTWLNQWHVDSLKGESLCVKTLYADRHTHNFLRK